MKKLIIFLILGISLTCHAQASFSDAIKLFDELNLQTTGSPKYIAHKLLYLSCINGIYIASESQLTIKKSHFQDCFTVTEKVIKSADNVDSN